MIKNLVTSGCSFTAGDRTWARYICDCLGIKNFFNLASGGAGNRYIASSVIDAIHYHDLAPEETLVLVMWSGVNRQDALVSGEYWYLLSDYLYKAKFNDSADTYWVHSGGRSNSWMDHDEVKKIFLHRYTSVDPYCDCKETLDNILKLENYLENNNFDYRFMSYLNYWTPQLESTVNGDFCIPYFAEHLSIYQKFNFKNWIFVNDQKDCIFEFCQAQNELSQDNFHPSRQGHYLFARTVLQPLLNQERQRS